MTPKEQDMRCCSCDRVAAVICRFCAKEELALTSSDALLEVTTWHEEQEQTHQTAADVLSRAGYHEKAELRLEKAKAHRESAAHFRAKAEDCQ